MARQNGRKPVERRPTERVILQRATVLDLTGVAGEKVQQLLKLVDGVVREGWIVVDQQTSATKVKAVEAFAGEAGTPEAKVGEWRAPTLTAWKGVVRHTAPPKPLVTREVSDE